VLKIPAKLWENDKNEKETFGSLKDVACSNSNFKR
jgi:hypothetical protein